MRQNRSSIKAISSPVFESVEAYPVKFHFDTMTRSVRVLYISDLCSCEPPEALIFVSSVVSDSSTVFKILIVSAIYILTTKAISCLLRH